MRHMQYRPCAQGGMVTVRVAVGAAVAIGQPPVHIATDAMCARGVAVCATLTRHLTLGWQCGAQHGMPNANGRATAVAALYRFSEGFSIHRASFTARVRSFSVRSPTRRPVRAAAARTRRTSRTASSTARTRSSAGCARRRSTTRPRAAATCSRRVGRVLCVLCVLVPTPVQRAASHSGRCCLPCLGRQSPLGRVGVCGNV